MVGLEIGEAEVTDFELVAGRIARLTPEQNAALNAVVPTSTIPSALDARLAENGLDLLPGHPDRRALGLTLLRTTVDGLEAVRARDAGAAIDTPARPPAVAPASRPAATEKPLLSAMRERWVKDSPRDLARIFASSIYVAPTDILVAGRGAAAHWLPLLALFTGARLEELGQLLVGDFKQVERVWCMHITDPPDDDDEADREAWWGEDEIAKAVKTPAARRYVPVHAELVREASTRSRRRARRRSPGRCASPGTTPPPSRRSTASKPYWSSPRPARGIRSASCGRGWSGRSRRARAGSSWSAHPRLPWTARSPGACTVGWPNTPPNGSCFGRAGLCRIYRKASTCPRSGTSVRSTRRRGTGVPFIDVDDIARVAARALTDPGAESGEQLLTGPEALTYDDVAARLSEVVGERVRHLRLGEDARAARFARAGLSSDFAKGLAAMDAAIANGAEDRVSDVVETVTSRTPTPFRAFAGREAAAWRRSDGSPRHQ